MTGKRSLPEDEYRPVRGRPAFLRLAIIGIAVLVVAGAFAYTGGWLSPGRLSADSLVDKLETNNGVHQGFRRNHAKGVCIAGSFTGNGAGSAYSKASLFGHVTVPVLGRFALASGQPYAPDPAVPVWSMALRFSLPDGQEWRTGMNNIPVFPVRTAEEFEGFLVATQPDPATGKPDPARLHAFLGSHPASAAALAVIQAAPKASSFASASYNALDAFRFVDAAGKVTPVRWSMISAQPAEGGGPTAAGGDANYLFDDLIAAIRQHPLRWRLVATLAGPGDVTADPTVAWPADRQQVELGVLTIDRAEGEATGGCRDINFDPLVLPSGIEASDDPLPSARSATYAQSVRRRDGEPKEPSAVHTSAVRPEETK